ncbi:MAG TPA: FAD-dependent oxidoreductase [Glaciibacter sp.]|nr:FAD-dependent oxidoreductase [Glaciibacter sp.]
MRDVVVVGGGPVGTFLASLLAQRGLDVLVLEQRTRPSMRSRAIGIHPPLLAALDTIGVGADLMARAVHIRVGEVYCDGRRLGRMSFEKAAEYPFVAALPQYETEALLRARFDALKPGGVQGGVTVVAVHERIDDRVVIETADGSTIDARYVVAADGARSAVRQSARIGWRSLGRRETYLMADFPVEGAAADVGTTRPRTDGSVGARDVASATSSVPSDSVETAVPSDSVQTAVPSDLVQTAVPPNLVQTSVPSASPSLSASVLPSTPTASASSPAPTVSPVNSTPALAVSSTTAPVTSTIDETAVLYFERGGVVESFPLPGQRRRWVAMTDGLRTDAVAADLADIIRSRTGVDLPPSADAPSPFVVQQHLADRMVAGRVILVGDAAHEVSPIGGQGMNLGWLDAVALAPALEQAVRNPAAAERALAAFDERRRRAARMAARQAGFNMAMGRPVTGIRLLARNALVRVLALPPARGIVARAFTMRWL